MTLSPLGFWLVLGWLAAIGACFGSFLNVVIYRLPRGESLSHPGSRCPKCGCAIRLWDNIPVLSWLVLRGRCRNCREPISIRYPLVELAGAVFAVGLAPPEIGYAASGDAVLLETGDPLPLALAFWAARLAVALTLLAVALIRYDGRDAGLRIYLPALLLFAFAMLAELFHRRGEEDFRFAWQCAYHAAVVGTVTAGWWMLLRLLPVQNDFQAAEEHRARTGVVGLLALLHGVWTLPLAGVPLAWVGFFCALIRRKHEGRWSAVPAGVLLSLGWVFLSPDARELMYYELTDLQTVAGLLLFAALVFFGRAGEWLVGRDSPPSSPPPSREEVEK